MLGPATHSDMWTAILAPTVALLGVVIGALLEPLKAAFAFRAKARQDRSDRAVDLIDAATRTRALLLGINLLNRYEVRGEIKPDSDPQELITSYRVARAELRRAVELIHLSGPAALGAAADRLREADAGLRATRFITEGSNVTFDRDKAPPQVAEASARFSQELRAFVVLARKFCR